jgi:outer membrane protein OmpA-like peptidoglycan-associated protein
MDDDGCPEIDADEDGVPDVDDKCPLVPETINGVDDDDGCPEEGAHSLVSYNAGAIEVEAPISFAKGSDAVTPKMRAQLYMIAQKLGGLVDRKVQKIIIVAYPDDDKNADAAQKLAKKRAEAIAQVLEKLNFPATLIDTRAQTFGDLPQGKPNYLVTVRLAKPPAKL